MKGSLFYRGSRSLSRRERRSACLGRQAAGNPHYCESLPVWKKLIKGKVLWDGKDISSLPVHQRRFGLMFQDYALFPHKSVRENVAFGLEMQRFPRSEIESRVASALAQVNLTGFESRRVTDLSGGEQQRVALARALAPEPHLLDV